jgi:hypothetical protein
MLHPRTPLIRLDPRALALVAVACAALFALSFAIGRALSPGRGGHSATLPEFAATPASAEIPVSLSVAPALELARPVVVVHAPKAPVVASAPPTAAPVIAPPAPQPTAAPVIAPPPVALTPAPVKAPSTSTGGRTGGGSAAPKRGGGVSFDSSG